MILNNETDPIYRRQNFGNRIGFGRRSALLLVDFTVGFNDPMLFGGGNIDAAVKRSVALLEFFRKHALPVAFTRVAYAEDGLIGIVRDLKTPNHNIAWHFILPRVSGADSIFLFVDRREVPLIVEGRRFVEEFVRDKIGVGENRIAVGRRLGHRNDADNLRGRGANIDNHRLPQRRRQGLRNGASDQIDRSARGYRDDPSDRIHRVGLGMNRDTCQQSGHAESETNKS